MGKLTFDEVTNHMIGYRQARRMEGTVYKKLSELNLIPEVKGGSSR